ncbi:hypothetical protein Tco_1090358 [Tanacetum coccineum]|uniref:Uncharacterized protein n=1 Tax=Tanacetum coccineum TaxID=301880 RepID=A0ABQ5I401_9ASTR
MWSVIVVPPDLRHALHPALECHLRIVQNVLIRYQIWASKSFTTSSLVSVIFHTSMSKSLDVVLESDAYIPPVVSLNFGHHLSEELERALHPSSSSTTTTRLHHHHLSCLSPCLFFNLDCNSLSCISSAIKASIRAWYMVVALEEFCLKSCYLIHVFRREHSLDQIPSRALCLSPLDTYSSDSLILYGLWADAAQDIISD